MSKLGLKSLDFEFKILEYKPLLAEWEQTQFNKVTISI